MEATKAAGISRQAYYKWLKRPKTRREIQDEELLALIQRLELEHQQSVGSGKMVRLIRKEGSLSFPIGKKRVRLLIEKITIYKSKIEFTFKDGEVITVKS